MILISNLNKTYSNDEDLNFSITDLNLEIYKNDFFGLVGKSGAGKSTILNLIGALELADSGSIIINDFDITNSNAKMLRQFRKKIGYVFQDYNLLKNLTILENIALPLKLMKIAKIERLAFAKKYLEHVGLDGYENRYPHQLSGGQKQRVAIARALINKPEILLCDEITSGLDFETSLEIITLLNNLKKELNLTIVFVSHDLSIVKKACNRVGIINNGCLSKVIDIKHSTSTIVSLDYEKYLTAGDNND